MFYLDFYFPHVAQGMNIRVGRYISLPDIEAQLAPNNYTYSHSILYTFDCYTQTGTNATVKINDHWTVQAGLSAGCDTMPWTTDAKVTGNVCVQYTWSNGGDDLYTCANSVNDGKYAYNNLAAYYETWYHRFNATWHTDTEFWYQYMKAHPQYVLVQRHRSSSPAFSTRTPPAPHGPRPPSIAPAKARSTSTSAPSARILASPQPSSPPAAMLPSSPSPTTSSTASGTTRPRSTSATSGSTTSSASAPARPPSTKSTWSASTSGPAPPSPSAPR